MRDEKEWAEGEDAGASHRGGGCVYGVYRPGRVILDRMRFQGFSD